MARAPAFSARLEGLDTLRQRLRPGYLLKPVRKNLIESAGNAARKTAQRAAKGQAGTGRLGRHILVDFQDKGMTAVVMPTRTIAGIAFVINYGRRPGRRPPYRALKRWADRAGIPTKIRDLQEDIKLRGTKGLEYMEAAENAANIVLRTGIPATDREIRALWKRPVGGLALG